MKSAWFLLMLVLAAAPAIAQSIESVDSALIQIDRQRGTLLREYDREKKQNEERRRRMESGSASDADLREAYASAARLDQMNARLNELNSQKQKLCSQWRELYRSTVDALLAGAEKETDKKKKAEAGRRLQRLQARNAQLCADNPAADPLQWRTLQIEAYDGPQEIVQKTQLLKDIERELTLRLGRLEDLYKQAQKERRTRERAQEFILEGTLFDQTVSVRAPGNNPVDTNVAPAFEGKTDAPGPISSPEAPVATDPGSEWQFSDNPKEAEEDYRRKRQDLLQQQKELEKKIHDFEEKAKALLHP